MFGQLVANENDISMPPRAPKRIDDAPITGAEVVDANQIVMVREQFADEFRIALGVVATLNGVKLNQLRVVFTHDLRESKQALVMIS